MIFLIGNKCDLDAQRDVTHEEAKLFASENGLIFVEASAKTGEKVEDAFVETAKRIFSSHPTAIFDTVSCIKKKVMSCMQKEDGLPMFKMSSFKSVVISSTPCCTSCTCSDSN